MSLLYSEFIKKIESFISKYYLNRVIRNVLFFILFIIPLIVLVSFLEYFFYFSFTVRLVLLLSFLFLFFIFSVFGLLIPFLKSRFVIKGISIKEAIYLISSYSESLQDKLINLYELHELSENSELSKELLEAAIDQKIDSFKAYQFAKILSFKVNFKYLKFLIPLVFTFLLLLFFQQDLFYKPWKRIIHYSQFFEREFPFTMTLKEPLRVDFQGDFTVVIRFSGNEIPQSVYLLLDRKKVFCKPNSPYEFVYTFKSLTKDVRFMVSAGDFLSKEYTLQVLKKPLITQVKMHVTPPFYTGIKPFDVENSGNANLPFGSKVSWYVDTENTDSLFVFTEKGSFISKQASHSKRKHFQFKFIASLMSEVNYFIFPYTPEYSTSDTLFYKISVVPDQLPSILVNEFSDTTFPNLRFFKGSISDDYGFSSLVFRVFKEGSENQNSLLFSDTLKTNLNTKFSPFSYMLDLNNLFIERGDNIIYYFTLCDNDVFSGGKCVKSEVFGFYKKSYTEEKKEIEKLTENLTKDFSDLTEEFKNISKQLESLMKSIHQKNHLEWEDKKLIESALKKYDQLQKTLQEMRSSLHKKLTKEQELFETSKELQEKQNELQDLLEKLLDPQLKKQLEELQSLLKKEATSDKFMEKIENLQDKQKELSKNLSRDLDIFKQIEFENAFEKMQNSLSDWLENMENLKKSTMENKLSFDSLSALQKNLNKEFSNIKKDVDELKKMNHDLKSPVKFNPDTNLLQEAGKNLSNSEKNLSKGDKKSAAEQQQQAIDKVENLQEQMSKEMEESMEDAAAEDMESIRNLLKNILRISFKQEDLLSSLQKTTVNNPMYAGIIRSQAELRLDYTKITDSIYAISVRQPQIASYTQKEVSNIHFYSKEVVERLLSMNNIMYQRAAYKNSQALTNQQYLMTSVNNLSLLLAESLDKMNQQIKASKSKGSKSKKSKPSASCDNPSMSKNKPSPKPSLKQMQEQLNKQMQALKKSLGDKNKAGRFGFSQEFAKAAAQQEMIRRAMQEIMNNMKQKSAKEAGMMNSILGEMEKVENDLVNKILSNETLLRQERILSRLLEAENAEMEREKEDKRESKQAKENMYNTPAFIEYYKKQTNTSKDVMYYTSPKMKPFYKEQWEKYNK